MKLFHSLCFFLHFLNILFSSVNQKILFFEHLLFRFFDFYYISKMHELFGLFLFYNVYKEKMFMIEIKDTFISQHMVNDAKEDQT